MQELEHETPGAALTREEALAELATLPAWRLAPDGKRITRHFCFPAYQETIEFVLKTARIAHREGHYPEMHIVGTCIDIALTTPAVEGLSANDFALATHIDTLHFVHMATAGPGEVPEYPEPAGGCATGGG